MRNTPLVLGVLSMVFGSVVGERDGGTAASPGPPGSDLSVFGDQLPVSELSLWSVPAVMLVMSTELAWIFRAAVFADVAMYAPFPIVLLVLMGRASATRDLEPV